VQAPEVEVTLAAVGLVELVKVCEAGEEGAGILGERMEVETIDGDGGGLAGQRGHKQDGGAKRNRRTQTPAATIRERPQAQRWLSGLNDSIFKTQKRTKEDRTTARQDDSTTM